MTKANKSTSPTPIGEAEKDILISKMLDCPGQLSDSEIDWILADEELRDIYTISVNLKAAKKNQVPLEASKEWELFQPLMESSPKTKKLASSLSETKEDNSESTQTGKDKDITIWSSKSHIWTSLFTPKRITRVASIFTGLFLVAGAIQLFNNNTSGNISQKELIAQANNSQSQSQQEPTLPLQIPSMSNENNENKVNDENKVKEYTGPRDKEEDINTKASTTPENNRNRNTKNTRNKSQFASSKTKQSKQSTQTMQTVPTNQMSQIAQTSTEDVDAELEQYLRVQRARMDNDLAMQRAEAVMNQYYAMAHISEEEQNLIAASFQYGDSQGYEFELDSEIASLILP